MSAAGLSVSLQQRAPIALDARFDCAAGEVLALVGPSGAGKSTILRCVAGTYRPGGGRVSVGGQTWFDAGTRRYVPPHRRAVGMVFQQYALFPHMSAAGNVRAAMGHLPPGGRAARASELLSLLHLDGLADRRPAELSGGQQQRVALARALAREPRVLLLDEPFSAVDRGTRERLYREIAALRGRLHMPVVLVTHDLDEALLLADRLAVLQHGRILQSGEPQAVTTRPDTAEVARLVNLRNVFQARIVEQRPAERVTVIDWGGRRLTAAHAPAFAAGEAVSWVIPDGYVIAHRQDRPSRGERENPVSGTITGALTLGPATHLDFLPDSAPQPLRFSVAAHVARRHGFTPGTAATVSLLAEGLHLMPADAAVGDEPL